MLKQFFAKTPAADTNRDILAIISPHAGYVFSGEVAAAAFSQIDREKEYKTIFVIGSSHRNSFAGASVYSIGNYITPLGAVRTDLETAQKLVAENKVLDFDPQYHLGEHSIEVQIPFLQYFLKSNFKIVTILLGTQDQATCEKIAEALKPYFLPEMQELLIIARNTIDTFLRENRIPEVDEKSLSPALKNKAGAFVTLRKNGELRGCIGHFEADNQLYKIVQQMAVSAAMHDSRFPAVTSNELNSIIIEISVLTPMQKISDVKKIRLGIDGIYIKKENRSGTFLPQVATDTGWSLEEFLGHCARDKAGIGWDGWKDKNAEIFVYQAFVFGEKE